MSKERLNLSIEKGIKQRAKEIASTKGISVSQFFEQLVVKEKESEYFTPPPGSGTEQFVNAIPDSAKVDNYDYKKLKAEMLEERYGNE